MNLRDFVPPVLLRLRNLRKPRTYNSFEDALNSCGKGYEDDRLANVVCEKTKIYRDMLQKVPRVVDFGALRPLLGMELSKAHARLKVIDFGGGCGAHYFLVHALIGDTLDLHWHVVETPAMVRRGRELGGKSLFFHTDINSAKKELGDIDLLYSSGALHYLPDPLGTLHEMIGIGASNIFLTRLNLSQTDNGRIVVQETRLRENGPGELPAQFSDTTVRYPATLVPRRVFESILGERYAVELVVDEGETVGYFARRKL
jgi:putative methyltransferase (TIGR04325 family)